MTDSPYAKPNKATKSSPSPLLQEGSNVVTVTSGGGGPGGVGVSPSQTRIHITETHTSHQYQPQHGEAHTTTAQATSHIVKQNQLDSMLGNLQADMSRQGVNTTQKGCCNACEKPIVGQVITALGKTWHPEHFTCTHCNQELGTRNFFEREGHPYCETDYHNLFSPRCAYCNGPILDVISLRLHLNFGFFFFNHHSSRNLWRILIFRNASRLWKKLGTRNTFSALNAENNSARRDSTRGMENLTVARITSTCLRLNAAAAIAPSWRIISLPSTASGIRIASSAG